MLNLFDKKAEGLQVVRQPVFRWVKGECVDTGKLRYGARVYGDLTGCECWSSDPLEAVARACESAASVSACLIPRDFFKGV